MPHNHCPKLTLFLRPSDALIDNNIAELPRRAGGFAIPAYSHRRMSLKVGREGGGSRVSFLLIFGSFGADQREAN